MARGRPKDSDPSVEWKIHVKGSLAAKVELLLLDPMRQKVKYGARGALLEQLLERWVEDQLRSQPNASSAPSKGVSADPGVNETDAQTGKVV